MHRRRLPDPMSRLSIAAISLVVCVLGPARALAQSAEAEALFNDAARLMIDGKIAEACEAFESSNRIEPRAGTLIRLGECRELNHQLASAWSAYKDALTRVRDPRKRDLARAKVAALEPRLSYLTVVVSDEVRIEGLALSRNGRSLDAGLWNRAAPIDGGAYVIGGRAPGREQWNTTVTIPPEGGKVSAEIPRLKDIVTPVAPRERPRASEVAPAAVEPLRHPAPDRATAPTQGHRKMIAVIVASSGGAALAASAIAGVLARDQWNAAKLTCGPEVSCGSLADYTRAQQQIDAARLRGNLATGLAAAGIATVGAGVVLWLTAPRGTEQPRPAWHMAPVTDGRSLAVALDGRF